MGIVDELASSLGQRGEEPDFRVAASLAYEPNAEAVSKVVDARLL